jgi:hypothetical protein
MEYTVSIKSRTISNIYVDVPVKVTLQKGTHIAIQNEQTGKYRAMAYVPGTTTKPPIDRTGSFPRSETITHSISSVHNNVYIQPVTVRVCRSSTRIQTGQYEYFRRNVIKSQPYNIIDNWGYIYAQSYEYIDSWDVSSNQWDITNLECSFY